MNISVCTFCKGRLDQAKRSLPHILAQLQDDDEVIFVDYSDADNAGIWARDNIKDAKLKIIWVPHRKYWHMNHARNCAGIHATKDILVFMDIDNLPSKEIIEKIRGMSKGKCYNIGCGPNISGFVAMHKEDYLDVNGYEEALVGHGYDDTSMYIALERKGIVGVKLDEKFSVIECENQVRIFEPYIGDAWEQNRKIVLTLLERHKYKVNISRNWGLGTQLTP